LRLLSSAIKCGCLRLIAIFLFFIISLSDAKNGICTARNGLYSLDPSVLWSQVEGLIHLTPAQDIDTNVIGIFVPGENYIISGGLLGVAYGSIVGKTYDVIVIITHTPGEQNGIFISSSTDFLTPLGILYSDKELTDEILKSCPSVQPVKKLSSDGFWYQIPFIQYALGSPRIINIQIGESSFSKLESLAGKFAEILSRKRTLVVGVSELAEGKNSLSINKLDKVGLKELVEMNPKSLWYSCENGDTRFESKEVAVFTLMLIKKLGAKRGKVLRHTIATGLPQEVHKGMAAISWSNEKNTKPKKVELSPADGMKLWELASAIICSGKIIQDVPRKLYGYKAGVFISLISRNRLVAQTGDLFTNMNVVEAVAKFAKIMASPNRIPKIRKSMLKNAVLVVSIANPVEGISLPKADMGIYIRRGEKVVVSMPGEFAEDSPQERLDKTCLKAGMPSKSWCSSECDVHFFTVQSFSGNLNDFYEKNNTK